MNMRMVAGLVVALAMASLARAETLIINPAQSFLELEVFTFGLPLSTPQLPGSAKAFIGGTLEVTVSGGQITFDGGSNLDFLEFDNGNTNLLPDVGGGTPGDPGSGAPADLGLDLVLPGLGTGVGAVRLASADVTGGPETLSGGTFDASNLELGLTAGTLDANLDTSLGPVVESVDISGNMAINTDGGDGFTTIISGLRFVHLPIDLTVTLEVEVDEGVVLPIDAIFTGQIVTIPEPSSLVLLAAACVALSGVAYRRKRHRSEC